MEAVYTFNQVGGQLWRLLNEIRTAQDLVDWVIQHFNVQPEQPQPMSMPSSTS